MLYEFEAQDGSGDAVELEYPMASAPGFDDVVEHAGRRWKRPIGFPQMRVGWNDQTSISAPAFAPGAKHYAPDGQPRFVNRRERSEFAARNGLVDNP